MTNTELIILEYLVEGRDAIPKAEAVLENVRSGAADKSSARKVFDGMLKEINRARSFAQTKEYAGCALSLNQLADDLETVREDARRLIR